MINYLRNTIVSICLFFCLMLVVSCDEDSPTSPVINTYTVTGRVVDISGNGIEGVSVTVSGVTSLTDSSGYYSFDDMLNGLYSLTFDKEGYILTPSSVAVTVNNNDVTVDDISEYDFEGISLVSISAGTFRMGDISGTSGFTDALPVHEVSISAFQMSAYEITQAQYEAVMGANPSSNIGETLPVETVSWYDAARFCNGLSVLAGLTPCYNTTTWVCDFDANGFRLPTEAEWEYACRAGTETDYSNGNSFSQLSEIAIINETSTFPVGSKNPNSWGLYDMHGNVKEMCNDLLDYDYYKYSPENDPTGPSTVSETYITRGGCYFNSSPSSALCRSSHRGFFIKPNSNYSIGFRIVCRP